jgi:hypothetical protein
MVARVLPVIARSLASRSARHPFPGPTRAEAVTLIERTRAARSTPAPARDQARPLARRTRRAARAEPRTVRAARRARRSS